MAILFDFDGTLVDTLPDLLAVLNDLLQEYKLPLAKVSCLRPLISQGSKKILQKYFPNLNDEQAVKIRQRFIDNYRNSNYPYTQPFAGITELLQKITELKIPWGIVTNRYSWLTTPLLEKFNLSPTKNCVFGCDNAQQPKPDPELLLLASKTLATRPEDCIYIGDAQSDIIAGNAAKMTTITAMFGYIPDVTAALKWPAHFKVDTVADILPLAVTWHKQKGLI